jgi:FMN phosphatase YigB (HAD superfamily)
MIKIIQSISVSLIIFFGISNALLCDSTRISYTTQSIKKVVVFDIGGVLATYSTREVGMSVFKEVVKECGFFKTIKYVISQGSKIERHLRNLIHSVLEEVGKLQFPHYPIMYNEEGNRHPRGLCLLHAGLISSENFTARALQIIQKWWDQDKALCKQYRRLRSHVEVTFIRNTIKKMGDGNLLATIFKPCKEGIAILKRALATPSVEVMILSNYPIDQFQALLSQPFMKEALKNIPSTHIFCSGQFLPAHTYYNLPERLLTTKPNQASFAEIILFCQDKWHIEAEDIIFIDNQSENVFAARSMGIDGLLVNSCSKTNTIYPCTFKELEKMITVRLQLAQEPNGLTHTNNDLANILTSIVASKAYTY